MKLGRRIAVLISLLLVGSGIYVILNRETVQTYTVPYLELKFNEAKYVVEPRLMAVKERLADLGISIMASRVPRLVTESGSIPVKSRVFIGQPDGFGELTTSGFGVIANGVAAGTAAIGAAAEKVVQLVSDPGALAASVVQGAKSQVLESFKEYADKKIDSFAEQLGVSVEKTAPVAENPSFPIAFGVKAGTPAYFTLKNSGSAPANYFIDWKDDQTERGILNSQESKTVSHQWNRLGEYKISFQFYGHQEKESQIIVSIFE